MCGIIGYLGNKKAKDILINGLKRMEYRGYDSTGIALIENNNLTVVKKKGKVKDLEKVLDPLVLHSQIGIGHTRWATHGEPNDINAHPHVSKNNKISLVHNGIIENYQSLKKELINYGYTFKSETDTEVLVNFIEYIQKTHKCIFSEALRLALHQVIGAYALVILNEDEPQNLFVARKGSPLLIGVGKGEYYVASDATSIVEYTNEVVYLNDEEIGIINIDGITIKDLKDVETYPDIQKIELELETIEKGGYDYFMLKEIFEQPESIANCMRGRLNSVSNSLILGGIRNYMNKLIQSDKITFLACGTSWHSAIYAEYLFEEICRIPVEVEYASEFRYRNPIIREGDVFFGISQSGETADTIAALELAKKKGAIIFGIVNVVGSSISRITHEGAYLHAGPEIGVASTKAFTAQLTVLIMIALRIAKKKGTLSEKKFNELLVSIENIPKKISKVLEKNNQIKEISELFKNATNFIYLGRGFNFPVALEGALKLKEISYIHAEGYPAAEMKHGPIALIDENMPVVFIAPVDRSYEKIISNIQEVKARKGKVIAIVNEGDNEIKEIADYTIEIPKVDEILMPIISVIPLQLLAYHIAVLRNCNVDQPRNLAKSVTVE